MSGLSGHDRDDVGGAAQFLADDDLDLGIEAFGEIQLGAAAEFDHADALAARDGVGGFDGADDAACDEADDLLDDGDGLIAAGRGEDDGVAFIFSGGLVVMEGVDEGAFFVAGQEDAAVAGAAVDVDVEDGKKDADADGRAAEEFVVGDFGDVGDGAVGGADDGAKLGGDGAIGVAEKGE